MFFYDYKSMKFDCDNSPRPLTTRERVLFGVFVAVLFGAYAYMDGWTGALLHMLGVVFSIAFWFAIFALLYKGWLWFKKPSLPFWFFLIK